MSMGKRGESISKGGGSALKDLCPLSPISLSWTKQIESRVNNRRLANQPSMSNHSIPKASGTQKIHTSSCHSYFRKIGSIIQNNGDILQSEMMSMSSMLMFLWRKERKIPKFLALYVAFIIFH